LALIIAMAAGTAAWAAKTGFAVDPLSLHPFVYAAAGSALLAAVCHGLDLLIPRDAEKSAAAYYLRPPVERLHLLAAGVFALTALTAVATVAAHLAFAASDGSNLRDAKFLSLDQRMTFDWLNFMGWLNTRPALGHMLTTANMLAPVLVAATAVLLGLGRLRRHLAEFIGALVLVTASAAAMLVLAPTAGAYVELQPAADLFPYLNQTAGHPLAALLEAFQTEAGRRISALHVDVLFMMPTLQAAVAVLVVYALRRLAWFGIPAAALSTLLMMSTLNEGGQYLSHVAIGAFAAVGAVLFGKALRFERRRVKRPKTSARAAAKSRKGEGVLTWVKAN
jgi:hypothetical protein